MEFGDALRKMMGLPLSEEVLSDFELLKRGEQAKAAAVAKQKQQQAEAADKEKNNNE